MARSEVWIDAHCGAEVSIKYNIGPHGHVHQWADKPYMINDEFFLDSFNL